MLEYDFFTIIQSLFWSVFLGVVVHRRAVRLRGRGAYDWRPWKTFGCVSVIATLVFLVNAAVSPSCVGSLRGGAEGGADPSRAQQGRELSASAPVFIPGQPFAPPGSGGPNLQQQQQQGAERLHLGRGTTGQIVYRYGAERQFQFIMAPPGVERPTLPFYPHGRRGPVHYHPNVPVELPDLDPEEGGAEPVWDPQQGGSWRFPVYANNEEHRWTIEKITEEYEKQESRRQKYLVTSFGVVENHTITDIIGWKYTSDQTIAQAFVEDFDRKPLPLSECVDFFTRLATHGLKTVIGVDMPQGDTWSHADWTLDSLYPFITSHPYAEAYVDGPYKQPTRVSLPMLNYWSQLAKRRWTLKVFTKHGGKSAKIFIDELQDYYDRLVLKMRHPNGEMRPPSMEYLKQLQAEEQTALNMTYPIEVRFPDGARVRVNRKTIETLREIRPQIQHGFILAFTHIPGYCYNFFDDRYKESDCLPQVFSHKAQWVIDGLWPLHSVPVHGRNRPLEDMDDFLKYKWHELTPILDGLKDDWIKVTEIPVKSRPTFEYWTHAFTFPDIMRMTSPKYYFSAVQEFVQMSQFLVSIAPQLSGEILKTELIDTIQVLHPHKILLFCRVPSDATLASKKTRLLSGIGLCYNGRHAPRDCYTTDDRYTCRGAQYVYILPPEKQTEPLPFAIVRD